MIRRFFCLSLIFSLLILAGCSEQQVEEGVTDDISDVVEEAEEKVGLDVPSGLEQCPDDIFSNMNSCMDLPDDWVCGYDHTIYEDGKEKDHGLVYRTPCHYCNFFGEDGVKDMMGTRVEMLGFTKGKC